MDPATQPHSDPVPDEPHPGDTAHAPCSLKTAFEHLFECLSELRDAPPPRPSDEVDRWQDQDYLYLELTVQDSHAIHGDTCIMDGRVHVRIHK